MTKPVERYVPLWVFISCVIVLWVSFMAMWDVVKHYPPATHKMIAAIVVLSYLLVVTIVYALVHKLSKPYPTDSDTLY